MSSQPDRASVVGDHRSGPEWWRGAVVYQIYPRSYQDSNGDGVGDIPGITARLGHIADLGADAVWLSPFFPSPMKDFGYDVSDYRGVDPLFGTLADFDAMVAEAHRLGLRVIIDQVLSHTSDLHPWFHESRSGRANPKADWYVWADARPDGTPPNNWLSVFGGPAWQWDTGRNQYYLHNFLAEQPDLNFHNPEVQAAVLADMRFWLERGVDGFRLDTVNFYFHGHHLSDNPARPEMSNDPNPYNRQVHTHDKNQPDNVEFLRKFRSLLDEYGATTSVGEVGEETDPVRGIEIMAEYTTGGDKLHMAYSFGFLSERFSPSYFRDQISLFESLAPNGWPSWSFSNHDVTRHVSRWAASREEEPRIARLAASILLSLRGTICLYQGEELGLPEAELAYEDLQDPVGIRFWPKLKGRDGCRTPMVWQVQVPEAGFTDARPWLPIPETHREMAADRQSEASGSILAHYKAMLAFRAGEPALTKGSIAFVGAPENVLAFERTQEGSTLLCAFNMSAEPADWPLREERRLSPVDTPVNDGELKGGQAHLPAFGALFVRVGG